MDRADETAAGKQDLGEHPTPGPEETGRISWLQGSPEAAKVGGEGRTWDDLQQPSDETQAQQQARLHAHLWKVDTGGMREWL